MKIRKFSKLIKLLKGFTLVELLVVLSLIGILAGLLIVSLKSSQRSALDARRKADLESIKLALEIYKSSCGGNYPAAGGVNFGGPLTCTVNGSTTTIMTLVPQDPVKPYTYTPGTSTYTLEATLETGQVYIVTPLKSDYYTPTATPTPTNAPTPTSSPTPTPCKALNDLCTIGGTPCCSPNVCRTDPPSSNEYLCRAVPTSTPTPTPTKPASYYYCYYQTSTLGCNGDSYVQHYVYYPKFTDCNVPCLDLAKNNGCDSSDFYCSKN